MKSLRDFMKRALFTSGGLPPSVAVLSILRSRLLRRTGAVVFYGGWTELPVLRSDKLRTGRNSVLWTAGCVRRISALYKKDIPVQSRCEITIRFYLE